jgi:hypothetical protein
MLGELSLRGPGFDIVIADADGRHVWLEATQDLEIAERRLRELAAEYRGTRLVLWNRNTCKIVAETEGY